MTEILEFRRNILQIKTAISTILCFISKVIKRVPVKYITGAVSIFKLKSNSVCLSLFFHY